MNRIIKERVDKKLHVYLDLIGNNVIVTSFEKVSPEVYTFGKYRVAIKMTEELSYGTPTVKVRDREYFNSIRCGNTELCSLNIKGTHLSKIKYLSGKYTYEVINRFDENRLSFSKKHKYGEGDNIKICIKDGKLLYVSKGLYDTGKNMYAFYGYIDEDGGCPNEILDDSMDEILNNAFKLYDESEQSVEKILKYLSERGIFGYFDENGEMNLLTFYDDDDDDEDDDEEDDGGFNLFSKTNPGQSLTEEEQQYLIGEVEKLRQDPFNYFIDW